MGRAEAGTEEGATGWVAAGLEEKRMGAAGWAAVARAARGLAAGAVEGWEEEAKGAAGSDRHSG